MKLKTFARRAAAAGAVLAALMLAALPALAAPKVQVSTTNAVADHADILSDETEQYVNDVSIKLSDACGAQIGVYTLDELLGSTTMEGFAYDVFNAWGLGSDDLDNGVLLLLAPNEADGGDYYIMRGDGLESQLSFSTLGSLLDEYMEPYWVNGDYDTGTQKTVQALANRLCSIYGVTLNSSYTDTSAPDRGGPNVMGFVLLVVAVLLVIWLITYLMRPRGPRPPRGGGGGSSFGNNMFWYSMGRRPVTKGFGLENLNLEWTERRCIKVDEHLQSSVPGVYVCGDLNGVSLLAHTAVREAEVAVHHITGKEDAMSYRAIPGVVYTNPEIAGVGMSEEALQAAGIPYRAVKLPMAYSGRFVAENEGVNGVCKVLAAEDGTVLGAHMLGNPASELIVLAGMAIEDGKTIEDWKRYVFPHPTVGEIFREL